MITCITYGDKKYQSAGRLNLETAKMHGADKTILYGPHDLPLSFKLQNWRVYYARSGKHLYWRGAGFWIWKSYIIKKTLQQLNEGDILIYSDAASVYVNDIGELLKTFYEENLNMMVFTLLHLEKEYTKRDAFVLLDADSSEYTDTRQRIGTYIVMQKNDETIKIVGEWHKACRDYRIITDSKNRMGKDNYPDYITHRHDQSILSIVAKKNGIMEYRDPSQYGNDSSQWPDDIIARSTYPQIWYSTRNPKIDTLQKFNDMVPDPSKVE